MTEATNAVPELSLHFQSAAELEKKKQVDFMEKEIARRDSQIEALEKEVARLKQERRGQSHRNYTEDVRENVSVTVDIDSVEGLKRLMHCSRQ